MIHHAPTCGAPKGWITSFYPVLTQVVIERIGYLGMHKEAETNHVYVYMDLNDKVANQGTVHRPITTKSQDFVLAQSDKVKNFLDKLVPSAKREKYKPEY